MYKSTCTHIPLLQGFVYRSARTVVVEVGGNLNEIGCLNNGPNVSEMNSQVISLATCP